jgi:hypothetical protein
MRYPLGIGEGSYHTEPPSEMLTAVEGSSLAPPRELGIDPMGVKGITRRSAGFIPPTVPRFGEHSQLVLFSQLNLTMPL